MEFCCHGAGCNEPCDYYCEVCNPIQHFCQNCSMQHLSTRQEHKVKNLYIEIDVEKIREINFLKTRFLEDLNDTKKTITSEHNILIEKIKSQLQEILYKLTDIENKYLILYNNTISFKKIQLRYFDILKSFKIPEELKKIPIASKAIQSASICVYPYFDWLTQLQNYVNDSGINEKAYASSLKFPPESSILGGEFENYRPDESLVLIQRPSNINPPIHQADNPNPLVQLNSFYLFFPNKRYIRTYNPDSNSFFTFNFNKIIEPKVLSAACKIEDNIYFYNIENKSYLLNFVTSEAEEIPILNTNLVGRGCTIKNMDVYLFGGSNQEGPIKDCYKIRIGNRNSQNPFNWNEIAKLPTPCKFNSASTVNNNIHIVGFGLPCLLFYDDLQNKFNVLTKLPPESKVLCENWIIVSHQKYLWKIDENSLVKYNLEKPWLGDCLAVSCSFRNGIYIYFVLLDSKIMRLDTEKKFIEKMK
jgi:hypothetical protein